MIHTELVPRWEDGEVGPTIRLQTGTFSRVICWLFGHDCWTYKHTIHTRVSAIVLDTVTHAPIIRHELTHSHRQLAYGAFKWLVRYFTNKQFRDSEEAIGKAAQDAQFPRW